MKARLIMVTGAGVLTVFVAMTEAREAHVTADFRGMEKIIRTQRSRRDKLEKRRSALAGQVTKVEALVERYLESLENDRRALSALDAEIAQANVILNDLAIQQVQLIEESRGVSATVSMNEAQIRLPNNERSDASAKPRSKPMPQRNTQNA